MYKAMNLFKLQSFVGVIDKGVRGVAVDWALSLSGMNIQFGCEQVT